MIKLASITNVISQSITLMISMRYTMCSMAVCCVTLTGHATCLQAMHNICLAHFERDKAAGGDMYARFAACYLKLSGVKSSQYNPEKLQQDMKEHDEGSKIDQGTPKVIVSSSIHRLLLRQS